MRTLDIHSKKAKHAIVTRAILVILQPMSTLNSVLKKGLIFSFFPL